MKRVWQIVVVAFKIVRSIFNNSDGFIISIGFSRENGRLQILLENSRWDKETANQIRSAHQKQLVYNEALQIGQQSGGKN